MNRLRLTLLSASLVGALASVALVLNATGSSDSLAAQAEEKFLLIERHGNEPLELVDLKIRELSVKSKIRSKFRAGNDGFDQVSFADSEDWSKHVRVRLRNVSGKRIVGFQAYLYLKPSGADAYFSVSLKAAKRLETTSLEPGEDIEARVDEDSWSRSLNRFLQYGGVVNTAEVSLTIGIVAFHDGLQWHKGKTLRPDPEDPNRRIPLERASPGLSRLSTITEPNFQAIAFRPTSRFVGRSWNETFAPSLNPGPVQSITSRCVVDNGSYLAGRCNNDPNSIYCFSIEFMSAYDNGTSSRYPVFDDCRQLPGPVTREITCTQTTTHYEYFPDPSCPAPSPTPTITCVEEGGVYLSYTGVPCCPGLTPIDGLCSAGQPTPTPASGPTPDRCAFIAPPTCPPGQMWIRGTYPFCYSCINNPFPSFSPTPTPRTPLPNGSFCFTGTDCQSGYCSPNFQCETSPLGTPTPTPLFRLPNGSICFSNDVCQSGYCSPNFECAPLPGPTPLPAPLPNGSFCTDDSDCQSYYCEYYTCTDFDWNDPGGDGDWCAWSDCSCWSDWECSTFCDWDGFCAWWFWLDPIVIDVNGDGFNMTDAENGVSFEFFGRGVRRRMSWTAAGADDAWLVLDRNRNGTIDTAKEMFSNVSPQPSPPAGELPIGFASLAEYDKAPHGGNGDGLIDNKDRIFSILRLWQDTNHNGTSESTELHSLPELGVASISVDYKESQRTDRWGNSFRYRAKVYGPDRKDLGRWAYDVVLFTSKPARGGKSMAANASVPLWKIDVFWASRLPPLDLAGDPAAGKFFLR